ncbi:hypothetical protein [Tsuneonella mangrovi]|nr:hypothetical protein [Tsuneonella mangrovi]
MRKFLIAFAVVASLGTSGCVAALAAGAGATTVACTNKKVDCPLD